MKAEIMEEFCDRFCKYPDWCASEFKDIDEALNELEKYCERCPINDMR